MENQDPAVLGSHPTLWVKGVILESGLKHCSTINIATLSKILAEYIRLPVNLLGLFASLSSHIQETLSSLCISL